jgi:hypothetical protein
MAKALAPGALKSYVAEEPMVETSVVDMAGPVPVWQLPHAEALPVEASALDGANAAVARSATSAKSAPYLAFLNIWYLQISGRF